MPRRAKDTIMTETDMIEYGKQKRSKSTLYKAESMQVTDEAISKTVMKGYAQLANAEKMQRIDFSDIDLVKEVSLRYIHACADASCFPTMSGLARAMGCNRSQLYRQMKKRDTEVGQWLLLCHDLYSDVLAEASLRNNCNPVVGIFLQKAMFGLSETENIAIVNQIQSSDYDDDYRPANWQDKYLNLIGPEDDYKTN